MRIIGVSLVMFHCLFAIGQESMSLDDAIGLGLSANYNVRIQQKNVAIAQNNNAWGETGILPNASATLGQNNSITNQESEQLFFGGQLFDGFQLNDQRAWSVQPGINVNWTFENIKPFISKTRLEQLQRESEGNAAIVIANTIQSISLAYYLAVLEKRRLEEFEDQLSLSRDKYQLLKEKSEFGTTSTTDLLLEENNLLTDSVNYINQALSVNRALRNLNTLLQEPDLNKDYDFTTPLDYQVLGESFPDLQNRMMSDNVDLRKIYISQEVLKSQLDIARTERLPDLNLAAGYRWNRNVSDLTSAEYKGPNPNFQTPPEPLINKTGTYFANFTVTFNLYNGGRINRAIRNAVVQQDIGNLQIEQLKQSLNRDLADAYDRYVAREQIYFINQRRKESSRINLDVSQEKYRNGTINSFDFRTVQNNYLSSAIVELQALYNLVDSRIELLRLTGGLIQESP